MTFACSPLIGRGVVVFRSRDAFLCCAVDGALRTRIRCGGTARQLLCPGRCARSWRVVQQCDACQWSFAILADRHVCRHVARFCFRGEAVEEDHAYLRVVAAHVDAVSEHHGKRRIIALQQSRVVETTGDVEGINDIRDGQARISPRRRNTKRVLVALKVARVRGDGWRRRLYGLAGWVTGTTQCECQGKCCERAWHV